MFPLNAMTTRAAQARPRDVLDLPPRTPTKTMLVGAALLSLALGLAAPAQAQDSLLTAGDAVVSGFSGIAPSSKPMPAGANPLDHFFIDLEGPSAQIMVLKGFASGPNGQRVIPAIKRQIKASEVGQVFAITLDDATAPNIFLGATSAFGIQIVGPDADGNGAPDRLKKGAPGARFMDGQFGPAPEGNPGTIWRVDGTTGDVSAFATVPGNSGPGLGDVVFDKRSGHFYASDLDTGLIHRVDRDGLLIDSFDHGINGRPAQGLSTIADDGAIMNIESPAFDSENPSTWGFTQTGRQVYGMAVHQNRLYYAVTGGQQVWSIGLTDDGSFSDDARWELDVEGLPGDGAITDMTFDDAGRMYLAQRGVAKGSYSYATFAEPNKSRVVRYTREQPDDPSTESVWVSAADEYAIGMPAPHNAANGGVALGYTYTDNGSPVAGKPTSMLWSTGDRLRSGNDEAGAADIHGLQGNPTALVRPQNVPPQTSYFVDYDGILGDAEKAGHVGDVEIFNPSGVDFGSVPPGDLPPGYFPPGDTPPDDFPEEWPDPETPYNTNLKLTKTAEYEKCVDWGVGYACHYEVRVTNVGPDAYFGPILVDDSVPAATPVAGVGFSPMPPWTCWSTTATDYSCFHGVKFLNPGESVGFKIVVGVKKSYDKCHLTNVAAIKWAPGGSQWNTNPLDDTDLATTLIPSPDCDPAEEEETNLRILKRAATDSCLVEEETVSCLYRVRVQNMGPGVYNGPIEVYDRATPASPISTTEVLPAAQWACGAQAGGVLCGHTAPAVILNPTETVDMFANVSMTLEQARELNCKTSNQAWIVTAPGGTPQNTDATDDTASANHTIPAWICDDPATQKTNLKIEKTEDNGSCETIGGNNVQCTWQIKISNTGAADYNGEIELNEMLPGEPVDASFSAPWSCEGVGGGGGGICKHPATTIAAGASLDLTLTTSFTNVQARDAGCTLTNLVEIAVPAGATDQNTDATDDTADATATTDFTFCTAQAQCPAGYVMHNEQCVRRQIKTPLPPVTETPDPQRPSCRAGWTRFSRYNAIPSKWKKYRSTRGGKRIWCAKAPRKTCREIGKRGTWPKCYDAPKQTCEQIGKIGTWPRCYNKPKQTCEQIGKIGKWPRCYNKPKQTCQQIGKLGKWPRCYNKPKQTCQQIGKLGKWPRCYNKPKQTCQQIGKLGKWPRCYNKPKKTCKQIGKLGKWPRCYNKPKLDYKLKLKLKKKKQHNNRAPKRNNNKKLLIQKNKIKLF